MSHLLDVIRYYAPYAIKGLLIEGFAIGATTILFYEGHLLDGIPWDDAVIVFFYIIGFLALSMPAYWVIKANPDGPENGAKVLLVALLVAAAILWLLIDNPVLGWCSWLALAPSAWMTIDYRRLLRLKVERANRSSYEKAMDEITGN